MSGFGGADLLDHPSPKSDDGLQIGHVFNVLNMVSAKIEANKWSIKAVLRCLMRSATCTWPNEFHKVMNQLV